MKKLSQANKIFGDELRRVRKAAKLSQETLAFRAGLDRTYISLLERGIKSPTLNTFFRLCNVLNLKPDEFVAQIYEQAVKALEVETEEE
jgi:transcriptional regulator with XRE-family HTH domain